MITKTELSFKLAQVIEQVPKSVLKKIEKSVQNAVGLGNFLYFCTNQIFGI